MNHTFLIALTLLIALLSWTPPAIANTNTPSPDTVLEQSTRYAWELGLQSLINAEQASRNLSAQVDVFLTEPTEATLTQLRHEWRSSHQQWQQHAVWIALAADQRHTFAVLNRRYFSIDARELQPGYLDAVTDYPFSGIVNDISIVLTTDSLRQQHGLTDESEVSLGFHAMEFLLWGEHGQRPFGDFVAVTNINADQNAAGLTAADLPNNRRRAVLRLINQVLADDLQRLRQDWQSTESSISQAYLQLAPTTRLALIQQTAHRLLAVDITEQLLQPVTNDRSVHHNQFAGDTHQHNLAQLNGLEILLTNGEHPLLNQILDAERSQEWQLQLRSLLVSLGEVGQEKGEVDTAKLTGLLDQLPTLAAALATGATATAAE